MAGVAWYHTYRSRRSPEGFPDYVIRTRPPIFAELKADGGTLSRSQAEWLEGLAAGGQVALLVVGHDGVEQLLRLVARMEGAPPRGGAPGRLGAGRLTIAGGASLSSWAVLPAGQSASRAG